VPQLNGAWHVAELPVPEQTWPFEQGAFVDPQLATQVLVSGFEHDSPLAQFFVPQSNVGSVWQVALLPVPEQTAGRVQRPPVLPQLATHVLVSLLAHDWPLGQLTVPQSKLGGAEQVEVSLFVHVWPLGQLTVPQSNVGVGVVPTWTSTQTRSNRPSETLMIEACLTHFLPSAHCFVHVGSLPVGAATH
jgi:hypothetical protein